MSCVCVGMGKSLISLCARTWDNEMCGVVHGVPRVSNGFDWQLRFATVSDLAPLDEHDGDDDDDVFAMKVKAPRAIGLPACTSRVRHGSPRPYLGRWGIAILEAFHGESVLCGANR